MYRYTYIPQIGNVIDVMYANVECAGKVGGMWVGMQIVWWDGARGSSKGIQ